MAEQRYFAAESGNEERQRIAGLETLYDPFTRRRLHDAGLATGRHCLEVGAGAGSIARMMAEVSGRRVVAVDLNPRFLDPEDGRYEIRQVDITTPGALGDERFDLIHCRFLLMHVPEPEAVLRAMASYLAPGGYLVAEEPNMLSWQAADPAAEGATLLNRVLRRSFEAMEASGIWHNTLGSRVGGLMSRIGLQEVDGEGTCVISRDEHPEVLALMVQSIQLTSARGVAAGVISQEEASQAIELVAQRAVKQIGPTLFGTLGRRPH